jgi:hypothetical protein
MKLEFYQDSPAQYPNGYWYASTTNGDYDADGDTPLNAITNLVLVLAKALDKPRAQK